LKKINKFFVKILRKRSGPYQNDNSSKKTRHFTEGIDPGGINKYERAGGFKKFRLLKIFLYLFDFLTVQYSSSSLLIFQVQKARGASQRRFGPFFISFQMLKAEVL